MLLVVESDSLLLEEVQVVWEVWFNVGGVIYVVIILWFDDILLIIDGLFGIGLCSVLCDFVVVFIYQVNYYLVLVVVLDIFFGLNVQMGVMSGVVVQVDYMLIFIVFKLGLLIGKVWDVVG